MFELYRTFNYYFHDYLRSSEIKTTFLRYSFIEKSTLSDVLLHTKIGEIKKCKIKKCNFALRISEIYEEAMCEFQFT